MAELRLAKQTSRNRPQIRCVLVHACAIIFLASTPALLSLQNIFAAPNNSSPPTFYRDVLPILQNHCQVCHRPGEIGPMPLVTYAQTKPFARAIAIRRNQKIHAAVVCRPFGRSFFQ